MERLHNWAIGTAGVMVAAVLTSLVASRWRAWAALFIAALALLALLGIAIRLWLVRPRLFIGEPLFEEWAFEQPDGTKLVGIRAKLHAWNEPRRGAQPITSLWLRLRFVDETTEKVIDDLCAKWQHIPYADTYEASIRPKTTEIPGDVTGYAFDVVALFNDGDEIYALSEQCKFISFKRVALGHGPIRVDVVARGATAGPHIDQTFRWRLTQTSVPRGLQLAPRPPLPNLRNRAKAKVLNRKRAEASR